MTDPLWPSNPIRPRTSPRPRRLAGPAALALLLAAACAPPAEDGGAGAQASAEPADRAEAQAAIPPFAAAVEAAHGADAWRSHDAFAADAALFYGGQRVFEGTITLTPDAARTRTERAADGAVLVFDGDTAWVSPADAEWPMARFHALTWPYFAAAPFKLADPGSHLGPLGERDLLGTPHEAARLTFDPGIGDSPDDWYVLYRDPATGRLAAMAYVVTYGRTAEEAEQEPHAIVYGEFVDVEGVQVPTVWQLYNWSEEEGVHGDPLGRLELSNPRFVEPGPETFTAPEGAREEGLPPAPRAAEEVGVE